MGGAAVTAALVMTVATPAVAFAPSDPLAAEQWYLAADHAFDAWSQPPVLTPVRVAIIDSGIDASHPELARRVVAVRSFVGGSATIDTLGHGTFVAGVIAAGVDDGVGIAGMFPGSQLIVAKVVRADGTIPVSAEAHAIRWAVDQGARVVNLSFGGVRDPLDRTYDEFSQPEAEAVAYAVQHGCVIVAAVGNGDRAPAEPWRFADYPAALPHVLGVSAYAMDGSVPDFSNRDLLYNDIAAPGEQIVSTLPSALTAAFPDCQPQGYSPCGPPDYRDAEGTSFAAPQVSAAAAILISIQPTLTADQVTTILERTAIDATPDNGCTPCAPGRDSYTGWGHLNVLAAIQALDGPLPAADAYEPNDDAGPGAWPLPGNHRTVKATIDYWDDRHDVYAVTLEQSQRLLATLSTGPQTHVALTLWRPGTQHIRAPYLAAARGRRRTTDRPVQLRYRAPITGTYYLAITATAAGSGAYMLQLRKTN